LLRFLSPQPGLPVWGAAPTPSTRVRTRPRASAAIPPRQFAVHVNTLKVSGAALAGEVSRLQWSDTGDPAAYAAETRARVNAVPVAPVTAESLREIEEFTRRARERGRAPPPIDRR
jgi:hypothetical protein